MAEDTGRRALGRGLAALIGEVESEAAVLDRARSTSTLPIEFLLPNPRNPRKSFDPSELEDLAASIRQKGIVQPILVRPSPAEPNRYEIIAGERRWQAAQRAALHEVPVVIREVSDKEALELAIIENVQRADLNALEEASGYQQLIEQFGYSQGDLAQTIGKSRPHVANTLRLLRLPDEVQAYVRQGKLTAGHARALVNAENPLAAARRIIDAGLTVRDAEALRARPNGAERAPRRAKDADTLALEKALSDAIGLRVAVDHRPDGGGEIRIRYLSLEQLDALCRRLQSE
jgi:ParB family transcriptional regulator, chromosome partitioning protein